MYYSTLRMDGFSIKLNWIWRLALGSFNFLLLSWPQLGPLRLSSFIDWRSRQLQSHTDPGPRALKCALAAGFLITLPLSLLTNPLISEGPLMGRYSQVVLASRFLDHGQRQWSSTNSVLGSTNRVSLAIDQSDSRIIQNSLTSCSVDYIVSPRLNDVT